MSWGDSLVKPVVAPRTASAPPCPRVGPHGRGQVHRCKQEILSLIFVLLLWGKDCYDKENAFMNNILNNDNYDAV